MAVTYIGTCRTDTPRFGFVVLNRLNSGNILQFVFPGMEFIIKDNFVMYKSSCEYKYKLIVYVEIDFMCF